MPITHAHNIYGSTRHTRCVTHVFVYCTLKSFFFAATFIRRDVAFQQALCLYNESFFCCIVTILVHM